MPSVNDRITCLLAILQRRPIVLVIDGIERWLQGWNGGAEDSCAGTGLNDRTGFFEGLDDFLQQASGLGNGTHVIITSRPLTLALDGVEMRRIRSEP